MRRALPSILVAASLLIGGAGLAFGLIGTGVVELPSSNDGRDTERERRSEEPDEEPTELSDPFAGCSLPAVNPADLDPAPGAPNTVGCPAVPRGVILVCSDMRPRDTFSECQNIVSLDVPDAEPGRRLPEAPSLPQEPQYEPPQRPDCGYGERLDQLKDRCAQQPWACTDQEEYDYLQDRCVPREPSARDCTFGERFDYLEDRCVPGPSSCTFDERYDYVQDRCVPR